MTRRYPPNPLIGLMIVLVMLVGPGLHALPGCGHAEAAIRADRPAHDGPQVEVGVGDGVSSCPVCDYLAQGQVVAERSLIAGPAHASAPQAVPTPSCHDLQSWRSFGCRAPPTT
jgi:hypothetical protein